MSQNRYYSSTAVSASLTAGITSGATTLTVDSTAGFPGSFPYTLILERDTANQEVIKVTGAAGTTLTVVRGQDGTSGITHSIGATVEHGVSAQDFDEPQAHIANADLHLPASIGSEGEVATVVSGDVAWASSDKTVRIPHTWGIAGSVNVPSGDADYIIPFFVPVPSGQTATIKAAHYVIHSGTSVTCKLQKNGSDVTGYTGLSATTTNGSTTQDATLADGDLLALVVTAVSGTPKNLTFTVYVDYTV